MSNDKNQKLMEQIALLLQDEEKGSDDSTFLRQSLENINSRLDKIEAQFSAQASESKAQYSAPIHPSQVKFQMIEELVDEIIVNQQIQKACLFETNKPCDNCSMCNSRGF